MALEPLFKQLGISRNEALVYLTLAEAGKMPASIIAKKTTLPRSTIYSLLESLETKGIIAADPSASTTYFLPNSPESLQRMVAKEKEQLATELKQKEQIANELSSLITPYFQSTHYSVPKIQFFEGESNVENMLYEYCPAWEKSIEKYDNTWWGYQDHQFVEVHIKWLQDYWKDKPDEVYINLFSNKSEIEKELKHKVSKRQIKLAPELDKFTSTIWIVGDYVVTMMLRQKPHYAFMLHDAVFAANQRSIFQMMWKMVK